MGIDRIGKGAPPQVPDTHGAGSAGSREVEKKGSVEKAFSVERPDPAGPAGAANAASATTSVDAAGPLARLRSGEIGVDGYVDQKVDQATQGLEGLSPAELDDIKKVLRDQLATDPGLTDLVKNAAGSAASIPEE